MLMRVIIVGDHVDRVDVKPLQFGPVKGLPLAPSRA